MLVVKQETRLTDPKNMAAIAFSAGVWNRTEKPL
jgi:hypothetical protein